MELEQTQSTSWLDRPVFSFLPKLNIETALVTIIIILAVLSRFVNLGARVMSHDEVNHVVPAYSLYSGTGYSYDPITHGPLQFHMMALSFFLLGDSDFSARAPDALVSVLTVVFVLFAFRRYLGRPGAVIAGFLYVISPFMMFYGRYTRNEVYGGLWTVLLIYAALRYLEKGERSVLYLMTVVMALHFTDKATAYIYNAQLLIFLGVLFLVRMINMPWPSRNRRLAFLVLMAAALAVILVVVAYAGLTATDTTTTTTTAGASGGFPAARLAETGIVGLALLAILAAFILLVRSLGMKAIRSQRTFDLIVMAGTLTLPLLGAFPVRMLGWDPLDYSNTGIIHALLFVVPFIAIAIAIGLWWKPRFWLSAAAIFFVIFTVFFTTFFTNGKGFFMGLMAALGYWLEQQGVVRGGQPLYYYILIQVPVYEYLAALGAILAFILAYRHRLFSQLAGLAPAKQALEPSEEVDLPYEEILSEAVVEPVGDVQPPEPAPEEPLEQAPAIVEPELPPQMSESAEPPAGLPFLKSNEFPPERAFTVKTPVMALLLFWSLSSLLAYSLAGERMPWLTVHIAGAMLLSSGWALGYLVDTTPWSRLANRRGLVTVLLIPIILTSLIGVLGSLFGANAPFMGITIPQLESTATFTVSVVAFILSIYGFIRLLKDWEARNLSRLLVLGFFGLLAVLTARTAYTASFINYDDATEFMVYAHAAPGPKEALAQMEEISQRITKGKDLVVAYDNETNYPWWWYLRDWPNKKYYGDTPGRDILDATIITVGDPNYAKVEPLVKDNYVMFEYMRLWWPMQDYWNLTWERIWNAISDPQWRQAIFDIWFNRDYTLYAQVSGEKTLTLTNWQPSATFRIYIRKDVMAQMWDYGTAPSASSPAQLDPYQQGLLQLQPDLATGAPGAQAGQFNAPRGLAVAPDGTIYVADSRNNRIVHYSADLTKVLGSWGTFADILKGAAPAGTFSEPWGVAVGPDSSVYVADTFNFRIQKFTADGKFIKMWGYFGQAEKPEAFWGPRGLAFDSKGRLFVTDTGNKRVVVFTADGDYVTSFGTGGFAQGQLDEPVGIAVDKQGNVYIADTWNQRIQEFAPDATGTNYLPMRMWDVSAWYGQSLDNKPFLALDSSGNVFVTDPEGGRILEFTPDGKYLRGISSTSSPAVNFTLPAGLVFDSEDHLYVTDGTGDRVMRFTLPTLPSQPVTQPSSPASPQTSPPSPSGAIQGSPTVPPASPQATQTATQ
jgi:predicted membrane-bound mannosyltransferase/DNA-binding beta-propeller fold protein YncE